VLNAINKLLGRIGECAIIEPWVGEDRWSAAIYLWDTSFNDSTQLAEWFHQCGATDVVIEHTLYCDFNGDRNGTVKDSTCRAWTVTFKRADID